MHSSSLRRGALALWLVGGLAAPMSLSAEEVAEGGPVSSAEIADAEETTETPPAKLSGSDIYRRYTERRIAQSQQEVRIVSRDPGGSEQLSEFVLRVLDQRGEDGNPTKGVRFKTRIDVDNPSDMRHTKYLIIGKDPGPNDEYVYQPSARRVRRVNLGESSFLGTDYTFGDFTVGPEADYTHERQADEVIEGVPVFVVETKARQGVEAQYPRVIAYVEQEHYVALRTRSFDDSGAQVKEMTAPLGKLRLFGDLWVASESTVTDLQQQTSSTLYIDELDPNPNFSQAVFSAGRLTRGK